MFASGSRSALLVHYGYQLNETTDLWRRLTGKLTTGTSPDVELLVGANQLVDTAARVSGLRRLLEFAEHAASPQDLAYRVRNEVERWRQLRPQADLERRRATAARNFWLQVEEDLCQGTFAGLTSWRKD